jgi:hypothetical protein
MTDLLKFSIAPYQESVPYWQVLALPLPSNTTTQILMSTLNKALPGTRYGTIQIHNSIACIPVGDEEIMKKVLKLKLKINEEIVRFIEVD